MTQAVVEIVKLDKFGQVPNSDFLNVTEIGGYTVVFRKDQFKPGDKALFIGIDSVLPEPVKKHYELTEFVSNKVKTKKLRGIYSQGLLLPLTYPGIEGAVEGQDVRELLGITKWKPPFIPEFGIAPWPDGRMIKYDIENLQVPKYVDVFADGEHCSVTEKIHGCHTANCIIGDNFFVTARNVGVNKPVEGKNQYWVPVIKRDIEKTLREMSKFYNEPNIILRGEIYGPKVQFLDYGIEEPDVLFYDIELGINKYQRENQFRAIAWEWKLPTVPLLYEGPFSKEKIDELAEKDSTVAMNNKKKQISEGVVVKPLDECSVYPLLSRKILKRISKRYAEKSADEKENDG